MHTYVRTNECACAIRNGCIQKTTVRKHTVFFMLPSVIMTSYNTVLLTIGLLCVVNSLPPNRRQWFYPIFDRYLPGECVHIDHPCNGAFNRTYSESYAKFPNPRGLTLDASMREFNDFFLPLNDKSTNCYLALWSFLCFHYFPQCHPSLPLKYIVTPCRETCERARSRCGDYLATRNITWPEHMDCERFNSSHDDDMCINSTADPAIVDKVNLVPTVIIPPPAEPTTTAIVEQTTSTPRATSATTTASTTTAPTPDPNRKFIIIVHGYGSLLKLFCCRPMSFEMQISYKSNWRHLQKEKLHIW